MSENRETRCIFSDDAATRVLEEFVSYVGVQSHWIDEKGVIDSGAQGSAVIALAQINGARAMTQKVLNYLYESEGAENDK